jgi:hypothetical protein
MIRLDDDLNEPVGLAQLAARAAILCAEKNLVKKNRRSSDEEKRC